jgi:processing peptidase subunit alpha
VEQIAGLPDNVSTGVSTVLPTTEVTTLSNGVKVASRDSASDHCVAVSISIGSGTRDEAASIGMCHVLKEMAFTTTGTRSTARIVHDAEDMGATYTADVGRDTTTISMSALRGGANQIVSSLFDVVMGRSFRYWEVDDVKAHLAERLVDLQTPDALLDDSIHAAAFYDTETLGRPSLAPAGDVDDITADELSAFVDAHYVSSNIVIVGAGVRHKDLVDVAELTFGSLPNASRPPVIQSEYVGGEYRVHTGSNGVSKFALAFGTSGPSDAAAASVLAELVVPPAAGKGFGMSTTNASSTSFAHTYADAGLVGVAGATKAEDAMVVFDKIAASMKSAAATPSDDAIAAAKGRAASASIIACESQETLLRDMGEAISATASHDVAAKTASIEAVTAADIKALASSVLQSNVSYAVVGDARAMPRHNRVAALFK